MALDGSDRRASALDGHVRSKRQQRVRLAAGPWNGERVPSAPWLVLKRSLDIVGALLLLILTGPVMACLMFAIVLEDRGPAFFKQERLGRFGRPFRICKLRTMRVGAPARFNADGSTHASGDDDRITRVGGFLRRTSLDELPQLWNVLRGDMSFIGPRPDLLLHRAYYSARTERKLQLRPGMTGLAQVLGRNEIPWRTRLRLDVLYCARSSFTLDAWIAARTVRLLLHPPARNG